jgi:hypothetical protein
MHFLKLDSEKVNNLVTLSFLMTFDVPTVVYVVWLPNQTHGSGSCGSGFTTLPAMRYCYRQRIPVYLRHNGVPTSMSEA